MDKAVLVPIAQGTEEMEAIIIIDILRRAGMNVKVAGENQIVTCARGTKIIPDILIDQLEKDSVYSAIILPGGANGTENLQNNPHLEEILKHNAKKGALIAAVCAAPTILVRHKLMPIGSAITSHPSVSSQFENYNYLNDDIVRDGNIITSRGAGTTLDFVLAIVNELVDKATADRIASDIQYKYF